jgi:hypothetical protein
MMVLLTVLVAAFCLPLVSSAQTLNGVGDVEASPDGFLVLSYCLKAVGYYHGPLVTRAIPELTYAFAAYTTAHGFSVNAKGGVWAGVLLTRQCRRHLETLQHTQPPLYGR